MDLAALIAKLESSTEGSRELDAEIVAALYVIAPALHAVASTEATGEDGVWPPRYTTSLDAALSLVPEGRNWLVERVNNLTFVAITNGDRLQQANEVARDDGTYTGSDTPALAVCLASLRARQALSPDPQS